MGRLSGFNYRRVVRALKKLGFEFHRHAAGSHEIWFSPATRRFTTVPNHPGDLPEGTLHAILRQAGVSVEQFLSVA
jgi:predicted RNA binding protein YcfA (HicA-like mRNA interferase family)